MRTGRDWAAHRRCHAAIQNRRRCLASDDDDYASLHDWLLLITNIKFVLRDIACVKCHGIFRRMQRDSRLLVNDFIWLCHRT